ncbi:MAG: DUF1287 domain-containing protein [Lachnotalea sp.]
MKRIEFKMKQFILISLILTAILLVFAIVTVKKSHSQKVYTAEQLGIEEIKSETDKDSDGIDDYTDIMLGARTYIETEPKYKSNYYPGGYPDDGYGVCTDVIWNAFQTAGYNLKDLLDADVAINTAAYTTIESPDSNIDFRRVKNLKIFFDRNAINLSMDFTNPQDWQAGDIVVFKSHIAICSDKRNADGIPFIIHHDSKGAREVNEIQNYTLVGHYRWASISNFSISLKFN